MKRGQVLRVACGGGFRDLMLEIPGRLSVRRPWCLAEPKTACKIMLAGAVENCASEPTSFMPWNCIQTEESYCSIASRWPVSLAGAFCLPLSFPPPWLLACCSRGRNSGVSVFALAGPADAVWRDEDTCQDTPCLSSVTQLSRLVPWIPIRESFAVFFGACLRIHLKA